MMKNQNNFQQTNQENQVLLRCMNCGKTGTLGQVVETPKGYLCRDCIRQQWRISDINKPYETIIVFLITAILSFIGSLILIVVFSFLSILNMAAYFSVFFLSPTVGLGIAEVLKAIIKKRCGSRLNKVALGGIIFGGLPTFIGALFNLWLAIINEYLNIYHFLGLAFFIIYVILSVRSCYNRLSASRRI